MPKALDVDWELIKALFCQGFNFKQISEKVGVKPQSVRSRANRLKWYSLRARTTNELKASAQPGLAMSVAQDLATASNKARNSLSDELHEQIEVIRNKRVTKGIQAIGQRAQVVNTITQTASKVYGWDSENDQRLCNVLVLAGYELPEEKPVQAIEVSSSVSPTESPSVTEPPKA